jgi:quercetin dioxygenase-like cupin family protein
MSDPFQAQKMEVLMEGENYHVVEVTLATGDLVPEHRHAHAEEVCYCLDGELAVLVEGKSAGTLAPGQRWRFPAGQTHRLVSQERGVCKYLAIHGGGPFDFVVA